MMRNKADGGIVSDAEGSSMDLSTMKPKSPKKPEQNDQNNDEMARKIDTDNGPALVTKTTGGEGARKIVAGADEEEIATDAVEEVQNQGYLTSGGEGPINPGFKTMDQLKTGNAAEKQKINSDDHGDDQRRRSNEIKE